MCNELLTVAFPWRQEKLPQPRSTLVVCTLTRNKGNLCFLISIEREVLIFNALHIAYDKVQNHSQPPRKLPSYEGANDTLERECFKSTFCTYFKINRKNRVTGTGWLALYFPTCPSHTENRQRGETPNLTNKRAVLTNNLLPEVKYSPPCHNTVAQHSPLIHFTELHHLMKTGHRNLAEFNFSEWSPETSSAWKNTGQAFQTCNLLLPWTSIFQHLWGQIFIAGKQVTEKHSLKNNSVRWISVTLN